MNGRHDEIATDWGIDAIRKAPTQEDLDLEKGDYVCETELLRTDSGMPWTQGHSGGAEKKEKEGSIHSKE
jgi:hypothetical protein